MRQKSAYAGVLPLHLRYFCSSCVFFIVSCQEKTHKKHNIKQRKDYKRKHIADNFTFTNAFCFTAHRMKSTLKWLCNRHFAHSFYIKMSKMTQCRLWLILQWLTSQTVQHQQFTFTSLRNYVQHFQYIYDYDQLRTVLLKTKRWNSFSVVSVEIHFIFSQENATKPSISWDMWLKHRDKILKQRHSAKRN